MIFLFNVLDRDINVNGEVSVLWEAGSFRTELSDRKSD